MVPTGKIDSATSTGSLHKFKTTAWVSCKEQRYWKSTANRRRIIHGNRRWRSSSFLFFEMSPICRGCQKPKRFPHPIAKAWATTIMLEVWFLMTDSVLFDFGGSSFQDLFKTIYRSQFVQWFVIVATLIRIGAKRTSIAGSALALLQDSQRAAQRFMQPVEQ